MLIGIFRVGLQLRAATSGLIPFCSQTKQPGVKSYGPWIQCEGQLRASLLQSLDRWQMLIMLIYADAKVQVQGTSITICIPAFQNHPEQCLGIVGFVIGLSSRGVIDFGG